MPSHAVCRDIPHKGVRRIVGLSAILPSQNCIRIPGRSTSACRDRTRLHQARSLRRLPRHGRRRDCRGQEGGRPRALARGGVRPLPPFGHARNRFEPSHMAPRRVRWAGSTVAKWRCTGGQGKAGHGHEPQATSTARPKTGEQALLPDDFALGCSGGCSLAGEGLHLMHECFQGRPLAVLHR